MWQRPPVALTFRCRVSSTISPLEQGFRVTWSVTRVLIARKRSCIEAFKDHIITAGCGVL